MRTDGRALTLVLLLAGLAGCGDATAPGPVPSPPPPPGPVPEGLWTASGNPSALIRLAPDQLTGVGDVDPATTLDTPGLIASLVGVAFGPDGTLWVSHADASVLLAYAPSTLAGPGSGIPTTVIDPVHGSLDVPAGLAFDAAHRLWVANQENGTLVRFDPEQLAAGGPQVPAVVLSGAGHPTGLAFDVGGGLWVSDNQVHTISQYRAHQLTTSGSPAPAVVLARGPGSPLVTPDGLAFDTDGNLWVANLGTRTVTSFGGTQLLASGSPFPRVVLSSSPGSFTLPVALAFGADGGLWVMGATGTVVRLDRASLAGSGAPAPSVRLTITDHSLFWSAAFWPKVGGLPLR